MIGLIFSAEIIDDNISYNKDEILDIKWFSYEKIISMKDELRDYKFIVEPIQTYIDDKVVSLDVLDIIE